MKIRMKGIQIDFTYPIEKSYRIKHCTKAEAEKVIEQIANMYSWDKNEFKYKIGYWYWEDEKPNIFVKENEN